MFRDRRAIHVARLLVLGGACLVPAGQTSCAPTWSVVSPSALPRGAVVRCQTGERVETLCGFLADSNRLVMWTGGRKLAVCDAPAGRRVLETSIADGLGLAGFRPNGTVVLIGSQAAQIWDLSGAGPRLVLNWEQQPHPGCCRLSPDGRVLAMGLHRIRLWNTRTGLRVGELQPPSTRGDPAIGSIHFTADGQLLAALVGGDVPKVILWRLADGERLRAVALNAPKSSRLAILGLSPDGRAAVIRETHYLPTPPCVAGPPEAGGPVRMGSSTLVVDTATGERLLRLSPRVIAAAAGRLLIEWPEGKSKLHVYDTRTARPLRTITAQGLPVVAGNVLVAALPAEASGQKTRDFGAWDLASGRPIGTVATEAWSSKLRALSPDGRMLLLDCLSYLAVVDRHSGAELIALAPKRHLDRVWRFTDVKFSPDGRRIAFLIDGQVGVVHLDKLTGTDG